MTVENYDTFLSSNFKKVTELLVEPFSNKML